MPDQLALELMPNITELARLNTAIDAFGQGHHWSPQTLFQVKLALEEAVTNILSYGYDGQKTQLIWLKVVQEGRLLSIVLTDNGTPFDPLERPPPDLDSNLEDRMVGGLGVYLIRQMMDNVSYQRQDGCNKLCMMKNVV